VTAPPRTAPAPAATDKHRLYQLAVQDAPGEVEMVERLLRRTGRSGRRLREDFSGTALLAGTWAAAGPGHRAWAVDRDPRVLAWARRHLLPGLGPAAGRLRLVRADAARGPRGPFDAIVALNFSWQVLRTRKALRGYLRAARRALAPGGVLLLDAFGGWEAERPLRERRRLRGGATYVWEQESFDPISRRLRCSIHFELPGGGTLRRAFRYDWRLWTLPELTELLAEAGLTGVEVLWDVSPRIAETSYRVRRSAEGSAGWIAYVVGRRPARGARAGRPARPTWAPDRRRSQRVAKGAGRA
jgi:SAM-dependent methyltransferase